MKERKKYIEVVTRESPKSRKKDDKATLHTGQFGFIILDGTEQSAIGLPHITTKTKDHRENLTKVCLTDLNDSENKTYFIRPHSAISYVRKTVLSFPKDMQ